MEIWWKYWVSVIAVKFRVFEVPSIPLNQEKQIMFTKID